MKLTRMEKQIAKDLDAGRFETLPESEMTRYREYARANAKDRHLTIRLNGRDLAGLKAIAIKKGKKYQTFIGELLHGYVQKNAA